MKDIITAELNPSQQKVVLDGDGPVLVLAGAGSGKTRTITYRVAYLLSEGVRPDELLLLTFTNKAANEMVERVTALTNGQIRLPWAGTFHGVAFKMLKQYAPLLGYSNSFTILDAADSVDLLKMCMKEEGVDRTAKRYPSAKVLHSIISFSRNAERPIADILNERYENWNVFADLFSRIANKYAQRKLEGNVMDFDDLLVNLYVLLLQHPHVRQAFSEQFKYILVDEYQDTNKIQAQIIQQFASHHGNILVVGDDAQSIYSFRAADIENILHFEATFAGAKRFVLTQNYRSTPEILSVANDVIAQNTTQFEKELASVQKPSTRPEVHTFATERQEAVWMAEHIEDLLAEGTPPKEIAVLFRAAYHSQALEMELVKRNIAYEYRGGKRFFERAHIKDVLAYVRAYTNPKDRVAWARVLGMQIGIGAVTLQKIFEKVQALQIEDTLSTDALSVLTESMGSRAINGWNDFISIISEMELTNGSPEQLVEAVVGSKYAAYLQSEYPDFRERQEDIEQLALFAANHEEVSTFLAEVTLQEQHRAAQQDGKDGVKKMVLSTIHQAKGLEWDVVFILHLSAGHFPSDRSLKTRRGVEEERRLFYVAITRARKLLYMSYPLATMRSTMLGGPSMFLEDMDRSLVHHKEAFTDFTIDPYAHGGRGGMSSPTVFTDPSDDCDDVTYEADEQSFGGRRARPRGSLLKGIDEL
ncbi:MAG: ATP-dependent helicase [Candidatus Magasanikbacteria bacterium]|jgi:DNA helicase II / ATP-dependent DNA helicase PcrA|nr:ATP-dependent helicase [Candidatus Magasanikbacteria bacterium]